MNSSGHAGETALVGSDLSSVRMMSCRSFKTNAAASLAAAGASCGSCSWGHPGGCRSHVHAFVLTEAEHSYPDAYDPVLPFVVFFTEGPLYMLFDFNTFVPFFLAGEYAAGGIGVGV